MTFWNKVALAFGLQLGADYLLADGGGPYQPDWAGILMWTLLTLALEGTLK